MISTAFFSSSYNTSDQVKCIGGAKYNFEGQLPSQPPCLRSCQEPHLSKILVAAMIILYEQARAHVTKAGNAVGSVKI